MERTTLFIGLTREVTMAGLPLLYLVCLIMSMVMSLILSKSILVLLAVTIVGYALLRAIAIYDPKIISVALTTLKSTPITPTLIRGEGVTYRA